MSSILLIRHAETDLRGTFCGHSNPPLNQKGQLQLQILFEGLRPYKIAAVHTSDLVRADSTARAIAMEFVTPTHTNPGLREIGFGHWEGLTWTQIEQRDSVYAQRWIDGYPHLAAPEGESYEGFRTRVLQAFANIEAGQDTGDIAIVTHAGVMQLLLTELCGHTPQDAYNRTRDYCSIVRFQPCFECTRAVRHA
ncbi:alpha-ribazole phosphatase/probable phosphoglycerate mutase [Granulicella rosea]|uniref:Alpha-ribazole phosphatase/probable phosphoglycerate mutase n=1 Tax=Granulicella rosea TaxID=474952 RepID=A0A239IMQ3_9BACT|nr:histidine phosphatase family protein [Granulicella rosea]SNS94498.1 alpha-ribazole phosphatase/probable phosphoglycerate mutase [Granulicella rosea]